MGVFLRRQKKVYKITTIGKLGLVSLVVTLAAAYIDTIWAVYMESLVNNVSIVSFISAFLTAVAFFSFFFLIPIIEKNNKSKLFSFAIFFIGIIYILFAINKNLYIFIALSTILMVLIGIKITSFGIIVRDKSSKKQVSRNMGLVYTLFNISWLIGPLIAGFVSEKYGISLVFLLSAIFVFLALFLFKIINVNDANIKKKVDKNVVKNFFDFFKDRDRTFAYILGGGVNFWLVLIYLYTPLFIIKSGLHIKWVGYFLFAIAIPSVLLDYIISKKAGQIGFRKIFKIGFFILFVSALSCFFISNIYIIMGILVFSGIGLSMIEPTTEAYFFDILKSKKSESKYYGPYNTAIDSAHFVSKVLGGLILLFFPFKSIFIFFALAMAGYFFFCFFIKNVNESEKR